MTRQSAPVDPALIPFLDLFAELLAGAVERDRRPEQEQRAAEDLAEPAETTS